MRTFAAAVGTLFALIVIAHAWRMTVETRLVRDPVYWLITGVAAALSVWAWVVFRRSARR